MFDVEFKDGVYEYTDNAGQARKYPTYEELDKCCNHCGVQLDESNLIMGNRRKNIYICRTCDTNRKRAWEHRRRNKNLEKAKQEIRVSEAEIKTGYVYVFSIPAYPDYVKIGMSIDVQKRKNGANTWTPFKDVVEHGKVYSDDKRRLESMVHHKLKDHVAASQEWFKVTPQVALKTIRECERSVDG